MTPPAEVRAAMVEAAHAVWFNERNSSTPSRPLMKSAITAAILAAEKEGFKLVGATATEEMVEAWRMAPGCTTYAERAGDAELLNWPERSKEMAAVDWTAMHAAAPEWGDGT